MRIPSWLAAALFAMGLALVAFLSPPSVAYAADTPAKPAPEAPAHHFNHPSLSGHLIPLDAIVLIDCKNADGHGDSGTGAVYQPGRVITANHVVSDAKAPTSCTVDNKPATIVWGDDGLDVAILEFDSTGYPLIPVSCAGVKPDQMYLAAGYSLGEDFAIDKLYATGKTMSMTIIDDDGVKHVQPGMAMTDGYLFQGQSGGPVFDLDGHMVGINDAAAPDEPDSLIRLLSDTPLCPKTQSAALNVTIPLVTAPKIVLPATP